MTNLLRVGAVCLAVMASSVWADTMEVEYSRFYSHLAKLSGEDVQALEFAFGFVHIEDRRLCPLDKVSIVTDKQTMPVTITAEQRFSLPTEHALKLADAMVHIALPGPANQCDMSVQLQTRPAYLKTRYNAEELAMLVEHYEAFFNEMGSFLSFMMPTVEGLTVHFADEQLNRPLAGAPAIQGGQLRLTNTWLAQKKSLTLPEKPLRITAIAGRG